jgi:PGF-CTERM protein
VTSSAPGTDAKSTTTTTSSTPATEPTTTTKSTTTTTTTTTTPGFEATFAVAGILAVTFVALRRRR